ncbi:MAG TPA: ADP-ribosylglycohydrolase [Flexistipes sinusarabici]|uniref:ADP-ribosylglycohydrolase n=1 Tax=Flexistipes sinusarabici TaxID=2352 RepID=A0A3D5QD82_FLESI|nr:ADP-ribosylglycohydrolase [Flexistipes sinusarabici]
MSEKTKKRAKGAVMGAFIGDALALGPHWYYDLEKFREDYGEWVDDYTAPKKGRYHEGLKAGDLSQSGYILKMLLESITENKGYEEKDFCRRIDNGLFPQLDGTPVSGPGNYTSQSIRDAYRNRVVNNLQWGEFEGHADTTEAIERTLGITAYYAGNLKEACRNVYSNTILTQSDELVVSMTVAFNAVLWELINGHPLDEQISGKLMQEVKNNSLPFHAVTGDDLTPPKKGVPEPSRLGRFASPDALLTPSFIARAAGDPGVSIEPAWKVSLVYGMPCAIYHILPSVYYLAARFKDDFESAVLHAVNSGGQNMARAMLTGALDGAQVGIDGIPARFIEGLTEKEILLKLTEQLFG